jgi:hypothetical protein
MKNGQKVCSFTKRGRNMTILGQEENDETILDEYRVIKCGLCEFPMTIKQADEARGSCRSCTSQLCVFCGCSERAPCFRKEYAGPCAWAQPGICDFCFIQLAHAKYVELAIDLIGGRLPNVEIACPGLVNIATYSGEQYDSIPAFIVPDRKLLVTV